MDTNVNFIFEFSIEDKGIFASNEEKNNTQPKYQQEVERIKEQINTYENRIEKMTGKSDIIAIILTVIVVLITIVAVADSTSTGARIASLIGAPLVFGGIAYGLYFIYGLVVAMSISSYKKTIENLNVDLANLMDKHFEKEQQNVDALLDEFLSKPTNND